MWIDDFIITKDTPLFLYGYNVISKEKAVQLEQGGYQFRGIIDRNADMYGEECPFPIITAAQLNSMVTDKEGTVIIICIRNAMQHGQIVRDLREHGFTRILYIPMEVTEEHESIKRLMNAYHLFLDNKLELINGVPSVNADILVEKGNMRDRLIYDEGDQVTFWCDIEDIFIGDRDWFMQRSPYVLEIKEFLFKVPIIHSYQHSDLFAYLTGKIDEPENCFSVTMRNNADRWQQYKQDRIELWELFSKWLRQGMFMFSIHACPVMQNAEGYFYLMDGGHRALFLYCHNIFQIPVRATREDYQAYLLYAKPEEYIYKSVELLLQEHLFADVKISDKAGLLIGDSYTNRFFEKCGKKVYHWEEDGKTGKQYDEVDYAFYSIVDENFNRDLFVGLLDRYDMIFFESNKNFSEYEMDISYDWHIRFIGSAIRQNGQTVKIYRISRKENPDDQIS